jgi:hypothetical protein
MVSWPPFFRQSEHMGGSHKYSKALCTGGSLGHFPALQGGGGIQTDPIEIVKVQDQRGNNLQFCSHPRYLLVGGSQGGLGWGLVSRGRASWDCSNWWR